MVNRIITQGRLVRDVDFKEAGGFPKATFTVAWSERRGEKETVLFLDCIAWRGTAELLNKYFGKGQEIVIEGKLVTESWEKDGEKRSRLVCNVDSVNFCGSKGSNQQQTTTVSADEFLTVSDQEELPFE